jgi:3-phytase
MPNNTARHRVSAPARKQDAFAMLETLEDRRLMSVALATVETVPVPSSGDSADDIAVWVHPTDSNKSTIIGTNKGSGGGLVVYDLSGKQLGYFQDGKMNNVDVRYGVKLGSQKIDIAIASNRSSGGSVSVYKINPNTRLLENVSARTLNTGMSGNVYGATLYQSAKTGKLYAFVSSRSGGNVEQWELFDNGAGKIDGKIVRTFNVGTTSEGMTADDETGILYVGEESVAVWKYNAEPDGGTARTQLDKTGSGGNLTTDIEGVAIYKMPDGKGYILVSSQGSDDFAVYDRITQKYIGRFEVGDGAIDKVTNSDGIDVTSASLGNAFSKGMFITQDGSNPGGNQNFKFVPWESIASGLSLKVDNSYNPRGTSNPAPNPNPTPIPEEEEEEETQPDPTPVTGAIKVNFQPASTSTPSGYLADTGTIFGDRGQYSYGWNESNLQTRDRNAANSLDQRYDTLNHMQMYGARKWEIDLPNGVYTVKLVAGDAGYNNSVYSINVEGKRVINGAPTDSQRWLEGTATVTVADGRLSVTNGSGAVNNKINFIEITPANGNLPAPTPNPTVPDPDPDPTPSPVPAPNPNPSTAKPGPNNTGPTNVKLLKASGSIKVTQDGAVVENVDVTGNILVYAKNVTIRNFRVTSSGYYGIKVFEGGSATIEHGEISGTAASGALLTGYDFTARYLNIHHAGTDGINPRQNNVIENNWVHHLGLNPSAHADAVQMTHGSNLVFRNNFFDIPKGVVETKSNAAFILKEDSGPISNILIEHNWMNGGNYTIYARDIDGLRIVDNRFGRDFNYGPKSIDRAEEWSGNVWDDTGAAINL